MGKISFNNAKAISMQYYASSLLNAIFGHKNWNDNWLYWITHWDQYGML